MKIAIDPNSIIQRNPEILFSKTDNEIVIMIIENTEYYGLDEIGSNIWELIEKPIKVSELIESLLNNFNIDRQICEKDTTEFLIEMGKKKIIFIT